jgi:DNA polymerase-3 subunit epsilon
MNARIRFLVAVVVLGLLMTGPFLVTALIMFFDLKGAERQMAAQVLLPRLPIGAFMTLIGFAVGLHVLRLLFRQYVHGLLKMGELLRLMLGANRNFRVELDGPPEVRQLARAANDLAQQRDELLTDVEAQIARAKASVEEEKNRLAALMSELTMGVVVCNLDGRILLYNNRARSQFKSLAQIGLGRSIFSVFERGQIAHALESIQLRLAKKSGEATANFVTSTRGGQLLRTQMAPVLAAQGDEVCREPQITGYVLTTENITKSFERERDRDQMLQTVTDTSRAGLASVRAAVETLLGDATMEPAMRERFLGVIGEEVLRMSRQLEEATSGFTAAMKTRWPLEEVLGADLLVVAQRRIEEMVGVPIKTEEIDDGLWIRADSFALIQGITFLAARLKENYPIRELRFRLTSEGNLAYVDVICSGVPVSTETLYLWEMEPMSVGNESTPLTLRDVIERHGGELWFQRDKAAHRTFFRFVLPAADAASHAPPEQALRSDSRPEYYDFDLFARRDASVDLDRPLADLAYSVFDTETTGLEPSAGDEIIQIGAVRVVNLRLLRQEIFDQIIDPRRPLRPEGIPIHGITEDMVRGQPTIDTVLPAFHEFCSETVLVAHNAAFDMRFLELKEAAAGVRFAQPVLDTLLLSAVIHPNQDSHRLETIAERLGINVIGRHTALGDAFVTGEVFLKLVPLLKDVGIVTLRQALEASEKTYYARVKY